MEQHLRCRIGFHKWVRVKHSDPDMATEVREADWDTRCRYCGRAHGSGIALTAVLIVGAVASAIVIFFLWSPLLGALIMVGAIGAIGWTVVPASISRVARWLSVGR